MKILMTMMVFLSLSTQATTHEHVKVELNFDPDYQVSEKVFNGYLTVVPEEWSFPSGTQTGKTQKAKYEKALEILEEVLNSEEFRIKVLSYKRSDGQRLYQKNYIWNESDNTLSNEDVYNLLMKGDEKMIPNSIGEMNIYSWVKICTRLQWVYQYQWCSGVVGSTAPSSSRTITHNWNFYKDFETPNMVANIVHEWIHLLGFLHGPAATMREEVPYVVGAIAGQVAGNILARENN